MTLHALYDLDVKPWEPVESERVEGQIHHNRSYSDLD